MIAVRSDDRPRRKPRLQPTGRAPKQHGAALLIALALLGLIVVGVLVTALSGTESELEKRRRTDDALAQAKAALIAYALARDLGTSGPRPGDLPCPDTDNDGTAVIAATGTPETCSVQSNRLGRLPWKTLGLPDLRDGDGERLWYAISNNFKDAPREACTDPTQAGCLNSDTRGTITVYASDGRQAHDAAISDPAASGVIAVVIAPGAVLRRQGAANAQVRDPNPAAPVNADPTNFLDVVPAATLTALPAGEDNAGFADGAANGFIQGPVRDAAGNVIANDRIITITYQDLMPHLEKRVAAEVVRCLEGYALQALSQGRYPSASPVDIAQHGGVHIDTSTPDRRGRIPDSPFKASGSPPLNLAPAWTADCTLTQPWWTNWKSQVFFAVAPSYAADATIPVACGSCLTVDPPQAAADKKFVVIVAGRAIPGTQSRSPLAPAERATLSNYLEGENDWTSGIADRYSVLPPGPSQNDVVVFR